MRLFYLLGLMMRPRLQVLEKNIPGIMKKLMVLCMNEFVVHRLRVNETARIDSGAIKSKVAMQEPYRHRNKERFEVVRKNQAKEKSSGLYLMNISAIVYRFMDL